MNSRQVFHYHIAEANKLKNQIADELTRMADTMARAESRNHPISEENAPGQSYSTALIEHRNRILAFTEQIRCEMQAATNILGKC